MPDEGFTKQKLHLLLSHLDELVPLCKISLEEYEKDYVKRYAVERLIEIIVEYAIDINRYVIESLGKAPVQTYYDAFTAIGDLGIIPKSLAARLASTTGLCNRLVHNYEKVQHDIVYYSLKPFVRNYRRYFALMEDYLGKNENIPFKE